MENKKTLSFTLPKLKYDYSALEPYIDALTVEIHYSKHHAAYTNNLNAVLEGGKFPEKSLEEIFTHISGHIPAVRNNGGGFYNHNLYWEIIAPFKGSVPKGKVLEALNKDFGSVDAFKDTFTKAAMGRFGSGWAWLVKRGDSLLVTSTTNQDNPLMDVSDVQGTPVLGIDVWEHAYYLKYQNRRAEYIEAFWKIIDWEEVGRRYRA
jgi:superoxide dismutase, Fe-Mn family